MIALITGATSGIGRATAYAFAKLGYDLIVCGRRQERLDLVIDDLQKSVKVLPLNFDIKDAQSVQDAFASLNEDWQKIDILINNAGNAHGLSSFDKGEMRDWDEMIDVNVQGLLYISRCVVPQMVKRERGHIVNISSVAGKLTYANGAVYCASKAAVEALSQGMRLDLTQHGIKVTNIAPGAVETEFSLVRFKGDEEAARRVYAGFDPLRPQDIADAIVYAVTAPANVCVADITLYAAAQAAPTTIYRK